MEIFTSIIISIGTVGVLGWLSKNWLLERLSKSIKHEYDKKLQEFTANINNKYDQTILLQTEMLRNLTSSSQIVFPKRIEAIQAIWKLMVKINSKGHHCFLLCDILLDKEFEEIPKKQKILESLEGLNEPYILDMMGSNNYTAEEVKLLSGNYLYAIYFVYRAVFGRIAHLFLVMKTNNKYQSWVNDPGLNSIILQLIDAKEWENIKNSKVSRFSLLRTTIENKYLEHANKILSGELSTTVMIQQGSDIVKKINESQKPGSF